MNLGEPMVKPCSFYFYWNSSFFMFCVQRQETFHFWFNLFRRTVFVHATIWPPRIIGLLLVLTFQQRRLEELPIRSHFDSCILMPQKGRVQLMDVTLGERA